MSTRRRKVCLASENRTRTVERTHANISPSTVTYSTTAFQMTHSADHKPPHVQTQTETPFLAALTCVCELMGWGEEDSRDLLISHCEVSQGAVTESSHKTWTQWKRGRWGHGYGHMVQYISKSQLFSTPSLLAFLTVIHYHNPCLSGLRQTRHFLCDGSHLSWPLADVNNEGRNVV